MNTLPELIASNSPTLNFLCVTLSAAIAGAGSMMLYRWVSPQEKLQALQSSLKDAQLRMSSYEGEFSGLWTLVKENLRLAMRRVAWSMGPSLIAGLPVILVFIALDFRDQHLSAQINQQPTHVVANIEATALPSPIENLDEPRARAQITYTSHATSPVAYESPVEYLPIGPSWMRSWIFLFVIFSTASALVVRYKQGSV